MPELPEVETVRQGIELYLVNQKITSVIIRQPNLRWPVPLSLSTELTDQIVFAVQRRGKYLLLACTKGTVIIHLGMSGTLRVLPVNKPPEKHDHIDIILSSNYCLRYRDPRRFGTILWTTEDPLFHLLLKNLGVEPLASKFNGAYLFQKSRVRKTIVKNFLMNNQIVVGIGNIYANEILFQTGIHPRMPARKISLSYYEKLVKNSKIILSNAIKAGGTTLKDFHTIDGSLGYFTQQLKVYGRKEQPCLVCSSSIMYERIHQRASYYCDKCQSMSNI
ncbi:bifunctional DNA-formamidopyrimidine glycosylase/DNA-(apurinic or apyrimidinic site) lyase [Candidatus Nitrosacidococcus sp. I8]|uniref:bifunctional DNA-formamidopyrimidine glycosylase/DNA-(apurinic or apyrimidinic site) lyase n=1 Tax=Candidatus Nitrosacidococcus sp. I8 TaxID=2942908 RepID=UPI002226261F|nr:bifunctional DNA-formamidopyrimidine glycosylase/DNA-(apurinic or apyrimidinic site) lyase [Candidatus Nitrosacidococcus sp. I8]CAH9019451.1 Formamidopyrimidine-DNA glycosylase [Candidatus Nitrosacidococcus sp. I8]